MNKDKEWLKEEINKVTSRVYGADFNTIKETDDLINQLDEPKITEEQALNKLAVSYSFSAEGINTILQAQLARYSPVSTVKFVQPSGTKLPAIPQFVAEAIEKTKENRKNITILNIFNEVTVSGFYTELVDDWILKNPDLFTIAWFSKDGYTIEKEQLYYMKLKEDLAEQMLLTRHKYLNVLIGKIGQAYTFDDKMGYSSYFKTKLTKEEVEIWKNKLNELEFDIVEVTE